MSIIERALAKAKQQDRAAVEDAEGLVHRAQVAPGADVVPAGGLGDAPDVGEAAALPATATSRRARRVASSSGVLDCTSRVMAWPRSAMRRMRWYWRALPPLVMGQGR